MNETAPKPPISRRVRLAIAFVGTLLLIGLCMLMPNLQITWRTPESSAQNTSQLGVFPAEIQRTLSPEESYARAAQAAGPAIVNIDTRRQVRVSPSFLEEETGRARYEESTSEGSGVIINAEGFILTNEHVVGAVNEQNKSIQVTLQDGRKFDGQVIGSDHASDVALVKINGRGLQPAKIGTVRGLVPGQMAVAIGNPFGLRFTVTHGVISALDRPVPVEDRVYERLIQTDCPINPGNSGGALVNIKGEVIGINTIVLSSANGIGFAIPIDTALRVAEELKRFGRVKRPWLGLVVMTNSQAFANYYNLPNIEGVVIAKLWRGGPGTEAQLRPGDVITALNGKPVRNEDDFKTIEKSLKIGKSVAFSIVRGDQKGNGVIIVGEAP